ncbi:MAG: DUF2452 domain-containing protein [Desulfofustis sp.]|nr:DUF2452 domain-containing protein [Desulfofustis sp.]NNF45786.1 DUF2452 domain-containing protein [Desulfofustis sp.]
MGKKYKGENVRPPAHSSSYPVSRLAPAMELVELARELGEADDLLTVQATAQLRLLAGQMEQLRAKAQRILAEARENQELHRAECGFAKKPGHAYHLYRKKEGTLVFSLVGPSEWGTGPPYEYVGTYRLELDRTWKKLKG